MLGERSEYGRDTLDLEELALDPIAQLKAWLDDAVAAKVVEPTAMCVSTVSPDGRPSGRMVLMRGLDDRGPIFFTNYESRKGRNLAENPAIAATFWWGELQRQVRIEGSVERVSDEESDAYFHGRPRDRQLASAASPQSEVISSREELAVRVAALDAQYPDEIPRPGDWGGFRIVPVAFEFWQGRTARMHDRFRYRREDSVWIIERLAP